MLIDCSYFVSGPRQIQNATLGKLPNVHAETVNEAIKTYIRMFQWPFLKGVLGSHCATILNKYLKQIENSDEEHDEDLDMIIEQLNEPFANYVFYKILRDVNDQATMTGLVHLKCANEYVSPIRRQVSIWNDMVDMIEDFSVWCKSSECRLSDISTDSNFLTKINVLNL